jgi:predicted CXXCH cytochrome family protein
MEHPAKPPDAAGFLGRPLEQESVRQCLGCHATTSRAALHPEGRAEAADRGIGCEHCHGPGGNHISAAESHFSDLAIARPRLAPPARVVALCARCHSSPSPLGADDPKAIRFQGPTFVRSRCYTESGEGFSCVTCHDPHRDAERSDDFYEAKCLSCHKPAEGGKPAARVCRVDPRKGCLGCHMPRVRDAVPRTTFTDHHIRIRAGSGG